MNASIHKFAFSLTACLLACFSGHAYEQDNWYLANEWSVSSPHGLAYYKDNSSGVGQIYVCNQITTSSRISVYDLNGSLDRHITIAQTRYYANDLALDGDGNIYIGENFAVTCLSNDGSFQWRTGKNASASSYGTSGSGDGEFNSVLGITIGPDNLLYVAERNNHRIQVLDKNGNFVRMFGSYGTAPGQLNYPRSLGFLPDGVLVIRDKQKIHWFEADGTFIKRMNEDNNDLGDGNLATFQSGGFLTYIQRHPTQSYVYDAFFLDSDGSTIANLTNTATSSNSSMKYATTPSGDVFTSLSNKIKYYKRAYRTKGLVNSNAIPHPKIHKISQRAGTNVLDLDFEIIDTDDANATIGIIAYAGSDKLVPKTWVDGTGSKINSPIATNQVHRVSWDVKQDWTTSTGTIKFEILCQDGRTNKPVDLHFLTLPFPDGNMTISRSPLKDSDFQNYAKYLLAKGDAQFESESSNAVTYGGNQILTTSWGVTTDCRTALLNALGSGVGGWKGSGHDDGGGAGGIANDGVIQPGEWVDSSFDTNVDGYPDPDEVAAAIAAYPSLDVDGDGDIDSGFSYRWATTAEITKAREAATPGAVNNWTASVQVKPRNLPGSVNEYGFDVSTTSGYWVIKE